MNSCFFYENWQSLVKTLEKIGPTLDISSARKISLKLFSYVILKSLLIYIYQIHILQELQLSNVLVCQLIDPLAIFHQLHFTLTKMAFLT